MKKILFVCWKKIRAEELRPSFFHYDKTKVSSNQEAKADHIVGITYHSSISATLRFSGGNSDNLSYPPAWMSKLRDKVDFDPDSICSLQKSLTRSSYELKCGGHDIQTGINI